jgi:hypothetical protein
MPQTPSAVSDPMLTTREFSRNILQTFSPDKYGSDYE